MDAAGYTPQEIRDIKAAVTHYEKVQHEVRIASGDSPDMKSFEPAMRHLLDTYIRAEDSRVVSTLADLPLIEAIVAQGLGEATEQLPEGLRKDKDSMAETIENNVRSTIVDKQETNPKYYEKMSRLLDALIQKRKQAAISYEKYLQRIEELSRQVMRPGEGQSYPGTIDSAPRRALYDNLDAQEQLAIALDEQLRQTKKDDWRGHHFKEREVQKVIYEALVPYELGERTEEIFELVKNQSAY